MKRALAAALTGAVLIGGLSAGPVSAKSNPDPAPPAPVTNTDRYDRNPTILQDGKTTWLFFARSKTDCDRLDPDGVGGGTDGCHPDNTQYDLMALRSTDGGNTWGAPELVAANPTPNLLFHGRNSAATKAPDGSTWLLWSSGGASYDVFTYRLPKSGGAWQPGPVLDGDWFNAEIVTKGKQMFVYGENTAANTIEAMTFDGTTFGAPVTVATARNVPRAIVDKKGVVRLAMVDAGAGDVYVTSSSNGLNFGPEMLVAPADGATTNWDPTLVQQSSGTYYLVYAPDRGDGNQQLAVRVSESFSSWSGEIELTQPEGWWDYWPEVSAFGGNRLLAAWTSESPLAEGDDAGTGHIWTAAVKL